MDKETAIEIIRIDAKIEQTIRIINELGKYQVLIDEIHELKRIKNKLKTNCTNDNSSRF